MESSWNQKMKNKKHDGRFSQQIVSLFGEKLSFYYLRRNASWSQKETGTECHSQPLTWFIFTVEAEVICYGAGAIPSTWIVFPAAGVKQGEISYFAWPYSHMKKRATYPYKMWPSLKIAGTGKQKKFRFLHSCIGEPLRGPYLFI